MLKICVPRKNLTPPIDLSIRLSDELSYALAKQGYRLLQVFETHFYPRYSLTLFQNFMMSFAKMKVASKGFPADCATDADREAFLEKLRAESGLGPELRMEHIQENSARTITSKLLLNAVIGKLGELCASHPSPFFSKRPRGPGPDARFFFCLQGNLWTVSTKRL